MHICCCYQLMPPPAPGCGLADAVGLLLADAACALTSGLCCRLAKRLKMASMVVWPRLYSEMAARALPASSFSNMRASESPEAGRL